MGDKKPKPVAAAKKAGKTNTLKDSLVECKVELESGEWISPESCKTFYINGEPKFPEIIYEIKTNLPGPYEWSWDITWTGKACPQAEGKKRFTPSRGALPPFKDNGSFKSDSKKWTANLNDKIIGGLLTVKVKAGSTTFIRKTLIRGKNPTREAVQKYLDANWKDKHDLALIKKIFQQETKYKQFYSDEMPLVSFDKGYGLGQLTNPAPTYEEAWCWKKHVKAVMSTIETFHRNRAKTYLDTHKNYTDDMLDLETLASYNGLAKKQRYHNWDSTSNKWIVNSNVICDPDQSNKGWLITEKANANQTIDQLSDNSKSKPFYTGRCYAEHIKNNQ